MAGKGADIVKETDTPKIISSWGNDNTPGISLNTKLSDDFTANNVRTLLCSSNCYLDFNNKNINIDKITIDKNVTFRLKNINENFIINNYDSNGILEIDISNNNNISNIITNKNNSIINLNIISDCSLNILNIDNTVNIVKKNLSLQLYVNKDFSNKIILSDTRNTIIFNVDAGKNYTYSGIINNSVNIIKEGGGNLIINNDNLNNNIIRVKSGTITINSILSNSKIIVEELGNIRGNGIINEGKLYTNFKNFNNEIGAIPTICSSYCYIEDKSLNIAELNSFKVMLGFVISIVIIYLCFDIIVKGIEKIKNYL
jgi:hypothetical protein